MSSFDGWLIKFNGVELPVKYMNPSGYSIEPSMDNIADEWTDEAGYNHTDEYEHKAVIPVVVLSKLSNLYVAMMFPLLVFCEFESE